MKTRLPNRVRETGPVYGADDPPPEGFQIVVADRGRLVLPAEVRERLEIKDGDRLWLVVDADGTIRIKTRAVIVRGMRGLFKHLAPGRSVVDELIADHRAEAAEEEREIARTLARVRKNRR